MVTLARCHHGECKKVPSPGPRLTDRETGATIIPSLFLLKESYAVVLLQRKADRLRKETGNPNLRSKLDSGLSQKEIFQSAIVRPTKMLLFSPVTLLMALYLAFIYGQVYVLLTALSYVFETVYGFDTGQIGLSFLGFGIGTWIGLVVAGLTSDRLMHHLVKRNGGAMLPRYRLPLSIIGGVLSPIGFFWFGWAADQKQHWVLPMIGTGVFGYGSLQVMVRFHPIDTFIKHCFVF